MNIQRVQTLVDQFRNQRVAVIGDLMIDRYIWGTASRISQEAPVPVVAVDRETATPGGAANVLRNLACLGAQPLAFGVIGDDSAGHELSGLLLEHGVATDGLIHDAARTTTEKTRIICDHQQVVRVDSERVEALNDSHESELIESLSAAIQSGLLDAIIIEDYNKGTVTGSLLQGLAELGQQHGIYVALDPHPGNRALIEGITAMTPNRAEAFAMAGIYPTSPVLPIEQDQALMEVVAQLQSKWSPDFLLITLGGEGMALFQDGQPAHHIPTRAREVFDVSGAGDTVISSFVLGLLAEATPDEAAAISNHAAGVVVSKVGTATVSSEELIHAFAQDDGSSAT
ncbi:MAG: PfkB family carbohydrate kinase [Candidatus Hydrogenedentota bacterium]